VLSVAIWTAVCFTASPVSRGIAGWFCGSAAYWCDDAGKVGGRLPHAPGQQRARILSHGPGTTNCPTGVKGIALTRKIHQA
jgi:hypothetical protein